MMLTNFQDHPDETKLKTYDLSYFTSTIGRTKEELIAEISNCCQN